MIKFFLLSFLFSTSAMAYVPTVESIFRHGGNPDVSANGVSLTLVVRKMSHQNDGAQSESLTKEERPEDHYRLFFTRGHGDVMKLAQARYSSKSFTEGTLEHKIYYPNFNAYTLKTDLAQIEKGLFFAVFDSILFNNGAHLVSYLKSAGVPVKLNTELINREKVEFLAGYKRYLAAIARDRNAKKTEKNPLKPEDAVAQDRADRIMAEPMYLDTKQVKLSRDNGDMTWAVNAEAFEAMVSYKRREIQRIKFKTPGGETEMILRDYWLANGTHSVPRYITFKGLNGESYQIEITNMRHYNEKEEDLIRRLKKWDELLKGKESFDPRPSFLL